MKLRTVLGLGLIAVSLLGCKTTVETEVSLSDLLNSETKTIPGELYVEVAGCADFQDSRKPSSSLIETQQKVPAIFPDAKFEECFRKKMDSFARFTVPLMLDKDKDGKLASDRHINLVSNDSQLLGVAIPPAIKTGIEHESKRSFGASNLDLRFDIKIKNDTGKPFPFTVLAAYVEDKPYIVSDLDANPDGAFAVRLSDVSVSTVMEGGIATVLISRTE